MDWKQILSQSPNDMSDIQKDEIYEQLVILNCVNVDNKYKKKMINLLQNILKHKGEMVSFISTKFIVKIWRRPHIKKSKKNLILLANGIGKGWREFK